VQSGQPMLGALHTLDNLTPKILRKREGLANGKKRRIRNVLMPWTIYVFAVSLARAKVAIGTVRTPLRLEERAAFGLGQMRMHLAISAPGVAQSGPVKGHRR
jgi:hypothetical protein